MGDFGEFGASIAQNMCLKNFTFECKAEIMGGDFVDFLCDLCLNRSIEKMTFYGCDFDSKNMFDVLIPFFISNEALESLHVHGDVCGLLASALGQFNSLKEFKLQSNANQELGATNARVGELIGTILYLGFFFLHLSCSY